MAGFFAAAAKTPFSTLIIVSEMTGGYHLLLPSLWVCTLSFILSDKQSIYSSQVESRSLSPAHQGSYVRQVLAEVRVSRVSRHRSDRAGAASARFARHSHRPAQWRTVLRPARGGWRTTDSWAWSTWTRSILPRRAPSLKPLVLAEDLMRSDVQPLTPDDTLDRALELFVENDLLTLPVVNNLEERQVVGMVRRFEISSAYLRHVHGPAKPDGG